MGITTSQAGLPTMPASVRARLASGLTITRPGASAASETAGQPQQATRATADLQPRIDTFTRTPMTPERREAVLASLTAMRDEILANAEKAAKAPGQTKSVQELLDEEFDTGLAEYESHKSRIPGADLYLTDDDKALVGLMYAKYEKKYGEGSSQLDKVDRFANELATLRGIGALVETMDDKKAAAARDARREERVKADATREAANKQAKAADEARVAALDKAITDITNEPVTESDAQPESESAAPPATGNPSA